MDGTTGRPDGAGSHIWLRYTTQFAVGERIDTIEIGIPVPLGASEEERASILREADAGMDQLARHVESRAARMQQFRSGQVAGPAAALKPPATAVPTPVPPPQAAPTSRIAPGVSTPAGAALPRSATQPPPAEQRPGAGASEGRERSMAVPPTRPNIGASMPTTPGNAGESLKLPQFIQFIKDKLNLTPREAMEMLNVKSLNGVNLRDAFEELQQMAQEEERGAPAAEGKPLEAESAASRAGAQAPQPQPPPQPQPQPSRPAPAAPLPLSNKMGPDILEIKHAVVREMPPSPTFDEELDDEEFDLHLDEDEDYSSELTENERSFAEETLSRLREARGASVASPTRLQALNNVVGEQLSREQLLDLVQGTWNSAALNKLKNEQVEALISWAKQDAFVEEAEVVLALLRENTYARSDR